LDHLVAANQIRESTLERLSNQYKALLLEESGQADDNDNTRSKQDIGSTTSTSTTNISTQMEEALQVELDLLVLEHETSNSANPTTAAAYSANLLQTIMTSSSLSGTPTAVHVQQLAQEIVESFQDLELALTALQKVLKHKEFKLQTKKLFLKEQESLLQSLQEQFVLQEESTTRTGQNTNEQTQKEQHEWIIKEIQYIGQQIIQKVATNETITNNHQRKRKRIDTYTKNSNNHEKVETSTTTLQKSMSIDKVIMLLLQRMLEHPNDPYMQITVFENGQQSQQDQSISSLQLLQEWNIVRSHPDNRQLICLTNYTK